MTPRWSDAGYARVAELVRERSGLVFPEVRVADVEAAVRRAMASRGLRAAGELADVMTRDGDARESLVAELTIGETYFNRDAGQFELLRTRILPELLADPHTAGRPLRVWSAGCASGEEPYSVAMLFDELGAEGRAAIVGTDIARGRLRDAQRAIYSRWSLRGMPDPVRQRYFTSRGAYFELSPRIRQRVDFRYLNLAEDVFPSLSTGIWGMDVILCRNVLIYFDAPTVERVARRLIASLSENGWLVLGASDPPLAELVECDVVLTDSGLVYRRPGAAADSVPRELVRAEQQLPPAVEPPPADPVHDADTFDRMMAAAQPPAPAPAAAEATPGDPRAGIADAYAVRDYDRVRVLAAAALAKAQLDERSAVLWLRALANEGCLDDALRVATSVTQAVGASAELYYLHAVLQLQRGQADQAAELARRALYLDRELVVAHLTLAETLHRLGADDDARRALRNAAALLDRMPPADAVPASDGETAGRLAEMTRARLRLLGESA
jgi:chemotaxis protein methyltransferase CheR